MAKKEKIVLSPYLEGLHKSGKVWYFIAYGGIIMFPLVVSLYFKAWPDPAQFGEALLGVVPTFWTVGVVEAFTYMPMLGVGGSYLGFVTGNMSNIKVPVAISAMENADVKQGTEEGDCVSTIGIAVSSIVTTVIIIAFVLLTGVLAPVFSNPALAPAFSNIVPALFGGLMVAFLAKDVKVGLPTVALGAALFIAVPALASVYPLILPVLALIAIGLARLLYKKGKLD